MRGKYVAEYNGLFAIGDGSVLKVVDNDGIATWASRNYALNLQYSKIEGAIGLNDINKYIWTQHNEEK